MRLTGHHGSVTRRQIEEWGGRTAEQPVRRDVAGAATGDRDGESVLDEWDPRHR